MYTYIYLNTSGGGSAAGIVGDEKLGGDVLHAFPHLLS